MNLLTDDLTAFYPQIQKGTPILPRAMAWRSNWQYSDFAEHTCGNKRKQNAPMIFAHHALFTHVYLHALTEVHTHLTNHSYSDGRKTPNSPNWSPIRDKDGAGSGILGLYLWTLPQQCSTIHKKGSSYDNHHMDTVILFLGPLKDINALKKVFSVYSGGLTSCWSILFINLTTFTDDNSNRIATGMFDLYFV